MEDIKRRIDDLAGLMDEFGLAEAEIEGEDWKVAFRRYAAEEPSGNGQVSNAPRAFSPASPPAVRDEAPKGTPVTSPMNGIFYSASSPSSPPFVTPGQQVTAGEVVGLIEAMKVFNEITAPVSGTVSEMKAENGQLVNPGDVLLYIG